MWFLLKIRRQFPEKKVILGYYAVIKLREYVENGAIIFWNFFPVLEFSQAHGFYQTWKQGWQNQRNDFQASRNYLHLEF